MSANIGLQVQKSALIAAAGTGGHIFPGLAIAEALKLRGWTVVWLGTKTGMENRIVPQKNIQFESIDFGGTRGKGMAVWLFMPYRLLKATIQCAKIIAKAKPNVVIGFGGYVSLPCGIAAKLLAKNLVIHEQNSVIGLSNKILSYLTRYVFTAFPNVLSKACIAGNPLRVEFINVDEPTKRFQNRVGPLRILIVGGSLGAKFLNQIVPSAIQLFPEKDRPTIIHQSGINHFLELQNLYKELNVEAVVTQFIENTASAFADADLIICRAGASTVTEIAAIGAAAIFVPLPSAVDDHQTKNAMYLTEKNAGWLQPQRNLTARKLADEILKMDRSMLLNTAIEAKKLYIPNTIAKIVEACEELAQ
jgi:UDP-N-acetylglucosamine--N-acetylmuramyl-(pentapeptide) pyrophosphoryl-undecaprenol N-acetylglucosamine transferase